MSSFKAIVSATFVVALSFVLASCVTEPTVSGEELEQKSLDAWIKLHRPELEVNRQKDGYYVEVLAWGEEGEPASGNDIGTDPTMDQDTCWVYTDLVARGLSGTVCLTRDHIMADMCGTFSYDTHYVPYFVYGGNSNAGIIEGSYKALRNEITLGEEYINKYWPGKSTTFKMRKGAKVRLYLPSVLAYDETGTTVEGGYEGQYSLSANTSMIMEMDIKGVVRNPSEKELEMVESYKAGLTGWVQATKSESESDNDSDSESKSEEKKEKESLLEGLYYSLDYNPKSDNPASHIYVAPDKKGGSNPYKDTKRYTSMEELDRKINEVLLKRFGEGLDASSRNEDTQVSHTGNAKVWYIGRFLDGFIFDTNIDEVKALISDNKEAGGTVFSYRPSDDDGADDDSKSAIGAWYYCISKMHHGAYGTILTTSGYAYGASGISGTTTTSSSSANDALYNYYNYYNYYASMYNYYDMYNYYNYNFYNYNYTASDTTTTTTTVIETEILPYTPLVFTVFVEKKE